MGYQEYCEDFATNSSPWEEHCEFNPQSDVEIAEQEALQYGRENPNIPWLNSPFDYWIENPAYK